MFDNEEEDDWPVPVEERIKCFEFNKVLDPLLDDYGCDHCSRYLTLQCPHIAKFLEGFNNEE